MNTPLALSFLATLGLALGLIVGRNELKGDALLLFGMALMIFTPINGAFQHFWLGWPWWPIAGVFWFGPGSSDSRRSDFR